MKLRTEVLEIGGQMRIATFYGCGDSGSPQEAISHDALAAHAYKQAEREADALFSKETRWYRARAWINTRADELMREWMGQ
jgi:hypothetical protein